MPLRVGYINYLNCVPFFAYLPESSSWQLQAGVPAQLNAALKEGRVDICPSSSIAYARQPEQFYLLPEHAIAATGPVHSVLFLTPEELRHLNGATIYLTTESATSVCLLRILLQYFYELDELSWQPVADINACVQKKAPGLLIGDQALQVAQDIPPGMQVIDLADLWYSLTGLPFVFALWILRRQAVHEQAQALANFTQGLKQSLAQARQAWPQLAAQHAGTAGLSAQATEAYWQAMDFDLTPLHLQGLELFYQLAVEVGCLEQAPQLCFWPD